MDSLLETERVPECSDRGDGSCTCTLKSNDGRSGMMYDGTSVGSTAVVFTDNSNCYNRDQLLERECGDSEQWSGDTLDQNDIHEGIYSTYNLTAVVTFLFLFSFGASKAEWVELCPYNSRSHSVCCWSMYCYCTGSVADSENQS